MFLLIDKPKRITSHDVVNIVRKITGEKKVGHAGTLDPNATGLLIVGVGREATRELGTISKDTKKTYIAEIFLGEERDTDDIEGKVIQKSDNSTPPNLETIKRVLKRFTGEQLQTPPSFSALKIGGKKAYELARSGESVNLAPRTIFVYDATLLKYEYPILEVEFEVSSGTYIRVLAKDIGNKLKTFGFLSNLRRTKVGKFLIKDAIELDSLTPQNWKDKLVK